MKTIEESVSAAMDVREVELLPFLPYILQDFWEIGSDPDTIIALIEKHGKGHKHIKVLDLGCGKGAVSVKVAKKFGCNCHGIDAVPAFIDYAIDKAKEYNISELCTFEVGDIREKVLHLKDFDVVILGSIGQVFGDYAETLAAISPCLSDQGLIIIEDAYVDDASSFSHPQLLKKQVMHDQIAGAGMDIIAEIVEQVDENLLESYNLQQANIDQRCNELMVQQPEMAGVFQRYAERQKEEYNNLSENMICVAMVLKRKAGVVQSH
ncbi:MAG: class I SAM-dependent methyltransferase [Bacteroidales bacterium]|nr:class I SAM-dependent methyltransferase [Bacteroidales bacterium]